MKPLIYITKSLPKEIVLELEKKFQLVVWEQEDFTFLEQAVEQADLEQGNSPCIETW